MHRPPGGRGGRASTWQHFQQQQYSSLNPPSQYNQPQSFYQHPQLPCREPRGSNTTSQRQREIVAFIEAFRTTQSSLTAPPNALTLDVIVRAICSHFHVNAFEELMGTNALELPALRQLHTVNQRVWTFVTCFMQSRRIHTLFECQQAFLQHEGLRSFHELKIGNSFLHTEAVQQLYHSPSVVMHITTRDVLSCLRQFEEMLGHDAFRASSHIDLHEFVQFLAQQYRQPSVHAMGVAIDPSGFGVYVGMLRRIANHEMKEIKTLEQQFQREVAEKMFRLTKEKFSDDNRRQALDELLKETNARSSERENNEGSRKHWGGKKGSLQSLSLEMLKRVTDVDVYLDNVLRRKAAADAKSQHKFVKPISSQEIAETDSKLRNQLTRFLMSSQKSRHHSRLKVVTWVICSIMAKTYGLLLSDDKLPDEDGLDRKSEAADEVAESDKEECDCCCVGKDSCTCPCTCKCHVESSDEEDEESEHQDKALEVNDDSKASNDADADAFPVMPTDPFASRLGKVVPEVDVPLEEVKTEVENFVKSETSRDNESRTAQRVLLVLSSLENHLIRKFSVKGSTVSWAGRQSVLEALSCVLSETEDGRDESEFDAGKWLLDMLSWREEVDDDALSSRRMRDKFLQEEVMPFVRECHATVSSSSALSSLPTEKQQQWIARRVSVKFECICTAERELPRVEEMLQLVEQDPHGHETAVIKHVGSLDLDYGDISFDDSVVRENATGESMHKVLTEQALEQLRHCPYLMDASLYMNWQERYAPMCGPLLSFLRVHEMILLDHAPSNNFMFVCSLNGTILRINERSTPSDLELLFTRAQQEQTPVAASHVAVHLVSMMVTCKSQANFPKQLVQAHLRAYLANFAKVDSYRPRFMVEVLTETPVEFADFVMSVLLGVGDQDRGPGISIDWGVVDQVWEACRSDAERKVLVFVSNRSLSPLWVNQTEKWCTVRENLKTMIGDDDAKDEHKDSGMDKSETKHTPFIEASNSSDNNDRRNSILLDIPHLEVALSSFSTESFDHDVDDRSLSKSVPSADSCYLFIEELRKKQFGVGLQIQDEATTSVLLIQQQRLERALKRLSDELYSESIHFVLELLQNADDNAYDDAVVPLGEFSLTADKRIVFYNNERGFSRENIQAICDVGASTKAANDLEASIGKKGIGFKSVFKVSDDPQVHSNGFHICFHAKNSQHGNGMGYILPYWLDDACQWQQRRGTTLVLPLNEAATHRVDDIAQSLMAFEPSVLLFLRRIRELRLRDLTRQHTVCFLKNETMLQPKTHIVQLLSRVTKNNDSVNVEQQNWLVVKETLTPPPLFCRSRSTEIALALPLALQREDCSTPIDRPPLQPIFAYLPLRTYGFRFIFQGDFEIPSSREAITNGSEWNEWLVSKLPALVRAAVSSYISIVERDGKSGSKSIGDNVLPAAISHFLSLLPLENEVQAPFRRIIPEIMRELRQTKWLIGASSTSSSSARKLLMPSELIDCVGLTGNEGGKSMTTLLETLSEDIMMTTFTKRFLHPALSQDMSPLMKSQLRIEQLQSSHLMRVLSLSEEKNDIKWTVEILAVLAKLWRKDHHAKLRKQELRLIKCFPLQQKGNKDGNIRWISLAEGHDSLFIAGVQACETDSSRGERYEFYGDLRILDDSFTKAVSTNSKLRAFLMNDVGIHVMEDHDLIRHHILPKMAMLRSSTEELNTEKEDIEVVIEYGKFLSLHLTSCSNCPMRAEMKANMVVAASSGRVVAVDTSKLFVVLPSTIREMPQLMAWIATKAETSTPGEDAFSIVSSDYFASTKSKTDDNVEDKHWRTLLVDVCDLPMLVDTTSLTSDSRSQTGMKQILKWIEVEENVALKRSISKHLAEYLDKHWTAQDSECQPDSSTLTDNQEDAFVWWRQSYWLEGSDGKFHRSVDLCLSVEALTRLFTPAMVTFTSMTWKNKDFSKRVLGMKADATVSDVLSTISSLSVNSTLMPTLKVGQMIRMYTFLWEESQRSDACRDDVMKAFSHKPLLFVPAKADATEDRSHFTGVTNVVWSSTAHNGELFALETQYPKALAVFFTEVCGVQRKPSILFLCEMIIRQTFFLTGSDEPTKLWRKLVLPLLCALSKKVKKRALSKTETKAIKRTLKAAPWLPVRSVRRSTSDLVCCSLKDEPVLATTESEKKLQKLVLSLAKKAFVDLDGSLNEDEKIKGGEDIKLVQLDADDDDLHALLSFAKVATVSAHLEDRASSWCKMFARFTTSRQLDSKKGRKKLLKLGQLLVKVWANAFSSSVSLNGKQEIQSSMQHLNLFPVLGDDRRWTFATNLYINDQVELSKQDVQQAGQTGQMQVLGLFSWSYFVDNSTKEDESCEATRVRKFFTEFCGMKSLKEHLQYEVSVLSTQHLASEAFHEKIRAAFALAQRFLFHTHRHLYDQLQHESIALLASELQCVLVDGHDGFQVVYRVENLFSLRRGVDALSRCFLDVPNKTLYMQSVTGDEEVSALSLVLMELSRKLFGAQVASSVANLVYLGLLQSNTLLREQWLVTTQLLPPLSASEAGKTWVKTPLITDEVDRKRSSNDFEDGEVAEEDDSAKKQCAPLQSHEAHENFVSPFASSADYGMARNGENYGMQTQRPPYPALPLQSASGNAVGTPYYMSLPSSSSSSSPGMQSLSLSNTMSKEEREAIGRWGEEYVYNQLKQQHADNESSLTVEWVNEKEESGLPYDLTLSSGNKVVEYIEVKSTRTMEKSVFEISMNELDQAAIHGSTYCIYRVFNAGNAALCRVIRMKNPVSLVRQRKIQLALVMQ